MSSFKIAAEIMRRTEYAYVLPELVLTIPTVSVPTPDTCCLVVEPLESESFQLSYGSVDASVCFIATPNPNLVCFYISSPGYMTDAVLVDISTRTYTELGAYFVSAVEIPEISTLILLNFGSFISIDVAGNILVYDDVADDDLEFLCIEPHGFKMKGFIGGERDVEFFVPAKTKEAM